MTKHHSSATISLKREFTKEDKLIPVITITVYLGTKEWDGPRKLSDMFGDVDEELLPFIPDYRINLLAPRDQSSRFLQNSAFMTIKPATTYSLSSV